MGVRLLVSSTSLRELVTFQTDSGGVWTDVCTVYAALSGLRNSEYWEQYAGGNADELLNVSVRYRADLMGIVPQLARMKHGSVVYDIITPPDDVLFRHREVKFKVRRQVS